MINVDYERTGSAGSPLRAFYKYSPAKNITNTTLLYPGRMRAGLGAWRTASGFQRQRYSAAGSRIPVNIEHCGLRSQTGLRTEKRQFIASQFVISHNHSVLGKYQYG
jgi:hypothetical protein